MILKGGLKVHKNLRSQNLRTQENKKTYFVSDSKKLKIKGHDNHKGA